MSWQVKRLEEIASFNLGKMLDDKKNKGDPLPYLANINVRWGEFELNDLRLMRFETSELERFSLKYGDIVMCEGGEPGRCAIWKEQLPKMMYQKALHRIRPHEGIDNQFLYYAFLHKGKRGGFSPLFTGSTIKHLPKEKLAKVEVEIPELLEQQRIATLLSKYDDLIENNKRRIELLEDSARQLYKEWFVRFRFPGHEHVKIIDGLPEGWKREKLPEIVDYKEGPGLRNHQYREEGIPFLNIRTFDNDEIDLTKAKYLDELEVQSKYQHFLLEVDDHVVSSSGTLGRLVTIRQCHLPLVLNTSLIRMKPKEPMTKWFLKAFLKYGDFLDQAYSMATGAAQLNYGPSHLKMMTVLMPPDGLIQMFEELAEDSYKQIKILLDCNLSLEKGRNLLLPKLMSGEIAV